MIPVFACLMSCVQPPVPATLLPDPPPALKREFRAVWVATVDNIDWPSKRTLTTEQAQKELLTILDRTQKLGMNAIILQVRPHADALYESKIEPWSEYLTGKQGKAPSPYWDPLKFAVDEAHKRGLELHAWFNPYRAWHPAAKGGKADNYIGKTEPEIVKAYGRYEWMDPAEPGVQDRTLKVMMDVVERYDIDGVHIDDYFYPYKEKDSKGNLMDFPDGRSWGRYKIGNADLMSRGDWRRKHVDDFIKRVYDSIKTEKPWVKFGISPFGIYRPGVPAGIKAGVDQYADLYADARKWLREGWCDYYTPQLYWPISQTPQAYPVLLKWWVEQNTKQRHMWPGNYSGRTDPANGNWKAQGVVDQIQVTRDLGAGGNVHFSMKCFMRNWNGIADAIQTGPYALPALVPASPWLDKDKELPPIPTLDSIESSRVTWRSDGEPIRFYVVQGEKDGVWTTLRIGSETSISGEGFAFLSVTPVDLAGNAGPPLLVEIK